MASGSGPANSKARECGVGTRPAVVYCAHGWAFERDTSKGSRFIARTLERVLARWCDAIVCISRHEMLAAERIGIAREKLLLISNGIPRENPRVAPVPPAVHWPEGKRRVLFVGRFDRQKGTDLLLAALSQLQDTTFCYLVGERVLGDSDTQSMPPNARVTGWLSPAEIEVFYQSADVVVVPSRWEGFGLIAVEAMRAGLPVVASRVGGLTEIVEDGVTGVLLPPEDVDALVRALSEIPPDRLATMGRAGRQRFLRLFTLERVHQQISDLYHSGLRATAGTT